MSTEILTNNYRKKEVDELLAFFNEKEWPEDFKEARIHYDNLGPEIATDINIKKLEINGIKAQILTPPEYKDNSIILFLHGGGFVFGSLKSHGGMAAELARETKCNTLQLDYRLAPEYPYPAALEDSISAYKWLLSQNNIYENIILVGDSAGGGLVLSTLLKIKEMKLPMPKAAVCICPWTDQEFLGESYETRKEIDPLVQHRVCVQVSELYLNGHNKRDPLVSPIHADLSGLPPLLIQVGEREILFSDAERLHNIAIKHGVDVAFEEWDGMVHVWHLHYNRLTDGRKALVRIGQFVHDKVFQKVE
ncbi:MAG: alpha/beta hydrolase [Burkholderiales bacterium]|nr:alpha/beta hydrolase [Burkholderiales bacterium]